MADVGTQRLVLRLRLSSVPRIDPGRPIAAPSPPPPPPPPPSEPEPEPQELAEAEVEPQPEVERPVRERPLVAERASAPPPPPPPRPRPLVAPARPSDPTFLPDFSDTPLPPRPDAPTPNLPPAPAAPAPSAPPLSTPPRLHTDQTLPPPPPEAARSSLVDPDEIDPERPAAAALLEAIRALPPAPPCTLVPVLDVRADVARFRVETFDGTAGEVVIEPDVDDDGWRAALDAAADPFFAELYEPVEGLGDMAAWAPLSHTLRVRIGELRMTIDLDVAFGTEATDEHLDLAVTAAREALRTLR